MDAIKARDPCYALVAKILIRSERDGFAQSAFTLSCIGQSDDQTEVLQKSRAIAIPKGGLPRPERLSGKAFVGKAAQTAIEVHSEAWITRV